MNSIAQHWAGRRELKAAAADAGDDEGQEVKAALAELTTATTTGIGKIAADVKAIGARQDEIEKKVNRARAFGVGGGSSNAGDPALETKAFATFLRTGNDTELKALAVQSDPDGGYLVHPALSSGMTKKLFDVSPIRQVVRVETVTLGSNWEEPIDNDQAGASWVTETETRPATSSPQVGVLSVPINEIYANLPITQRLLDDSGFDVAGWAEGKIAEKFARLEGSACISGDGIKKPRGLLTYPTSSVDDTTRPWGTLQTLPSGAATSVTADALRALTWAVRAPYRPGAVWMMSSATAGAIDALKDGNGQYLWRNGMTAGAQNTLLGYPVQFCEDMPTLAASSLSIAFGNFRLAYVIVDKAGYKSLRDPYTNKPYVMLYIYRRTGGGIANTEAVKLMQTGT